MNRFLYLAAGSAIFAFASCSNEEVIAPATGGDGNVNLTISLPGNGLGTRAFADGYSADNLRIAVYNAADGKLVTTQDETFGNALSKQVSLNLANGRAYKIVFFATPEAPNAESIYTFDWTNATMTVNYSEMKAYNSADYDCFYKLYTTDVITGPINETIELKRPVAQVNWGTNDLLEASISGDNGIYGKDAANLVSGVTVKNVNNQLNLLTGATSGNEDVTVTFTPAARPAAYTAATADAAATGEKFPVDGYDYLSMQYLLVPATSSVVDLELVAATKDAPSAALSTVTVSNAPVQANYRTNIYGALLTSPADFTVVKDPNFDLPDNNIEVITVASVTALRNAISNAKDGDHFILVPADENSAEFDLTTEALNINADVTIEVPAGVDVKTKRLNNAANIIVGAGKNVALVGEGSFSGDNRIVDVDGILTVDGPTFNTTTPNRGAAITANPGSKLEFKSGSINAANCALWIEGDAKIEGGEIISTNSSSNPEVGGGWSYAVRVFSPGTFEMNGGTIKGTQGALTSVGGTVTVNDGLCYTENSTQWGNDAFYAVYATSDDNQGHVIINGGYFYAPNKRTSFEIEGTSCIVSGDDDTGKEKGSVVINGGYFSGKAYDNTGLIELPTGSTYESCDVTKNGMKFTWTIKK